MNREPERWIPPETPEDGTEPKTPHDRPDFDREVRELPPIEERGNAEITERSQPTWRTTDS
jgi:hypothetical protein